MIEAMLKLEAKECGYHHRWVTRAMDILIQKATPIQVQTAIYECKSKGKKIGSIVYAKY
jgi:hypothetical protein